jgi:hypothetical protein
MTKSRSSADTQVLQSALKLAKNGAIEEAQAMVAKIEKDLLPPQDLRTLALIQSYCGRENDAEQTWESICAHADVGIGDCFMLASTQIGLGYSELAIGNLQREIAMSENSGDVSYLSVSAINLAFLLAKKSCKAEALDVLNRVGESEGTHIHGVGQVTKYDLLVKLGAAS